MRADVARMLLPLVEDDGWFFDTELLVRAHRAGCTIAEIPVRWTEDRDTRVKIIRTAIEDVRGVRRLRAERVGPRTFATAAAYGWTGAGGAPSRSNSSSSM